MKKVIKFCLLLVLAAGNLTAIAYADEVTDWNQIMLDTLRKAGASPITSIRVGAIVQSAVYDAVNGINGTFTPIHVAPAAPRGASLRTAAVQAAYATLVKLFPTQQSDLDASRAASLAAISSGGDDENEKEDDDENQDSRSMARGIEWGQTVADGILAWRSADGFADTAPPFLGGSAPGQWRPTPPAFAPGLLPLLGNATPFVIRSGAQFPQAGPPPLTSDQYATDFNEVKLLGSATSPSRTSDQTVLALFWQSSLSGPDYFWDRVAVSLGAQRRTSLSQNARILAMVNIALADAVIAAWYGKYKFAFWRPLTAIQNADDDGNAGTSTEAGWTPLLVTPPYPDYPSGLLSVSSAALAVIAHQFGQRSSFTVDSNGMPGVVRFFPDVPAALDELVNARILAGIHFRTADVDAIKLGTAIGNYIIANSFQSVHKEKEDKNDKNDKNDKKGKKDKKDKKD